MADRILLHDLFTPEQSSMSLNEHGYLNINARIARSGIQEYYAAEFWPHAFNDREWDDVIRVYRPPEEVFSDEALASFRLIPVTNDHPFDDVTASNWREHSVGTTHGDVERDGDLVKTQLLISDAAAVNDVQRGKRELSSGYTNRVEIISGATPIGEAYDAISREIRGNHVAIVDKGRAGSEVRAGDARKSPALIARLKDSFVNKTAVTPKSTKDEKPMSLRKITVDGFEIEVNDAAASAISKLTGERDDFRKKLEDATVSADAAKVAHDAAIAAKENEITELKDAIPTAEDLERQAGELTELKDKAAQLLPQGTDLAGKTPHEIRKATVDHHLKDKAKDYNEDQVRLSFDTLAATVQPNGNGTAVKTTDAFTPGTSAATTPVNLEDSRKARNDRYATRFKRSA